LTYLDRAGTQAWLQSRLAATQMKTLNRLAEVSGINKGTLSRYFNQTQRPTIDVVAVLCQSLKVTPSELLYGLGALPSPD
jgi:transcriptional regulator with XRE-family HTH domain